MLQELSNTGSMSPILLYDKGYNHNAGSQVLDSSKHYMVYCYLFTSAQSTVTGIFYVSNNTLYQLFSTLSTHLILAINNGVFTSTENSYKNYGSRVWIVQLD